MDPIILVFAAIAVGCIGLLLFLFVRTLNRKEADSDEGQEQTNNAETEKEADESSEQTTDAPSPAVQAPKRNWSEVAHLWRDDRDGRLIFQIEDQHYKRGDELTTREREILLKIVMDFYRWLEPPSVIPSKPETSRKTKAAITSNPDEGFALKTPTPEKVREPQPEDQSKPKKERLSPVNFVSRVLSSDIQMPAPAAPSIVAQIDIILQEMIEVANMQKWAIRLIESPEKGMIVMVGLEQYTAIDDVPYERVRRIIRAAVAEWEKRAEAGNPSS